MSVFSKLPNDIIMKIIRMSIGAKELHKINIKRTFIQIRKARAKVIEIVAQPNPWWMSGFSYDFTTKVSRAHDLMRKAFNLKRDLDSMTPAERNSGYRYYRSWIKSFDPNTKRNF